ncbi:hypothetical protein [Streptomyces phaeochromogenes]
MSDNGTAKFGRTDAAQVAGAVLAALEAGRRRVDKAANDDEGDSSSERRAGYGISRALDDCIARIRSLAAEAGYHANDMRMPDAWTTELRKVDALRTDDHFWHEGDECWYEVRDIWTSDDDPAEWLCDEDVIAKIREAIDSGPPYSSVAVRVIDMENSSHHDLETKVFDYDAFALLKVQVPKVERR